MADGTHRYSRIAPRIDVDAFEEAIGFVPIETDDKGNDVGQCPDLWGLHKHGDQTGKFAIHREKRVYNCWVCGGGSLLSLAMEFNGLEEDQAIDWLLDYVNDTPVTDEAFLTELEGILAVEQHKKAVLPYFNPKVAERFQEGHPMYEEKWGIPEETRIKFKAGFNPEARKRKRNRDPYIGPGLIFPHIWKGRMVGWQTRWLDDARPSWVKKYTNTTDFPRETSIFNYETVYLAQRPIVVVESVPTVLFLDSLDIPAVATFGSNVTPDQFKLLRSCQQGLILAADNDEPGRKLRRTARESLSRFVSLRFSDFVGKYESGDDLSDIHDDPDRVRGLLDSAQPAELMEF